MPESVHTPFCCSIWFEFISADSICWAIYYPLSPSFCLCILRRTRRHLPILMSLCMCLKCQSCLVHSQQTFERDYSVTGQTRFHCIYVSLIKPSKGPPQRSFEDDVHVIILSHYPLRLDR